jgi:hypothetical protein
MELQFDAKGNVKLPRIKHNDGFLGPEYYGCCGTGKRPKILRCRYSNRYIVGADLDVTTMRPSVIHDINAGSTKRVHRKGKVVVWTFTTRKSAVAKFSQLCREVIDWNKKTHQECQETRRAAARGDMSAAARLLDF